MCGAQLFKLSSSIKVSVNNIQDSSGTIVHIVQRFEFILLMHCIQKTLTLIIMVSLKKITIFPYHTQ